MNEHESFPYEPSDDHSFEAPMDPPFNAAERATFETITKELETSQSALTENYERLIEYRAIFLDNLAQLTPATVSNPETLDAITQSANDAMNKYFRRLRLLPENLLYEDATSEEVCTVIADLHHQLDYAVIKLMARNTQQENLFDYSNYDTTLERIQQNFATADSFYEFSTAAIKLCTRSITPNIHMYVAALNGQANT